MKKEYTTGQRLIFGGIKSVEVLIALNEPNGNGFYMSILSKKVNITKSYLTKLIFLFKKNGWIISYIPKDNLRMKKISLTEKGKELARNLFEVYHLLDENIKN